MKILKTTLLLGLLCFVVCALLTTCKSVIENTAKTPVISKPFRSLEVKSNQYAIRADQDTVLTVESGTRIRIAANSLVDASNKPVEGEVLLEYTEYQNPAEILISGIRMTCDSAGTQYGFESAGMFSIDAVNSAGEPVFIGDDASVNVSMGSYRSGNDYTFYYLDTVSGEWQSIGIAEAQKNNEKNEKIENLNKELTSLSDEKTDLSFPKKYQPGDKLLNLDIDYSRVPELRPFHSLVWRYAGEGGKDDPEKHQWIYAEKWTSIILEPSGAQNGKYELKLGNKSKTFTTVVEPVLHGKDLANAEQVLNAKLAEYDRIINEIKNEALRVEREANLRRSFDISRFGIYNWDKFYKDPDAVKVMADFRFDQTVPGSDKATIYLIIESRNAVIPYYQGQNTNFSFVPGERNKLLAVLPDERLAVFTIEDFAAIRDKVEKNNGETITITLKVTDKKMQENKDVSDLIASL
jgi:hypothetical protein